MRFSKLLIILFFSFSKFSSYCQNDSFVGYAVSKVNQDSIISCTTFGYANEENKIAYAKNTIQPIGSVSKTFIGLALIIAQEKGIIDLDTNINDYLDFEISNPNIKEANTITLRHLATHTSGIIDDEIIYESSYTFDVVPKNNLHDFFYKNLALASKSKKKLFSKYKAGENYSYSNVGAALAAYVLEKASGKPFNKFTQEYIYTPLQMKNTGWFFDEIDATKLALLYDENKTPLAKYSCDTYPDGSLKTTITDLSLYLIELIKGYNGNSNLISKNGWSTFFSKQFSENHWQPQNSNPKEPNSGIFIFYFPSGEIGHTGSDLGASSVLKFNPKTNTGQIFMANEDLTKNNVATFKTIWKKE
ncbi:serine hydrolase [Flavobacterium sp. NRK F7]|uniref:serine hydrolase domain-containing protein n=1 Tax=Flavobacterium sp. NRK F7 TaxID=2954930 RepID=UPI002091AF2A|nr:serine hydrolase [Flavobacterium sp. NRK F7]MCO6163813.1 beta-lactamase family protein [Flavobacterium sp. NRK F7]